MVVNSLKKGLRVTVAGVCTAPGPVGRRVGLLGLRGVPGEHEEARSDLPGNAVHGNEGRGILCGSGAILQVLPPSPPPLRPNARISFVCLFSSTPPPPSQTTLRSVHPDPSRRGGSDQFDWDCVVQIVCNSQWLLLPAPPPPTHPLSQAHVVTYSVSLH